eukprot:8330431-Pyramimonas_sp.AAC.1
MRPRGAEALLGPGLAWPGGRGAANRKRQFRRSWHRGLPNCKFAPAEDKTIACSAAAPILCMPRRETPR